MDQKKHFEDFISNLTPCSAFIVRKVKNDQNQKTDFRFEMLDDVDRQGSDVNADDSIICYMKFDVDGDTISFIKEGEETGHLPDYLRKIREEMGKKFL